MVKLRHRRDDADEDVGVPRSQLRSPPLQPTALGFDFGAVFLGLEASFAGAAGGFGFAAGLWLVHGLNEQFAEALEDGEAVGFLGAVGVGGDVELVGGQEALAGM